MPAINPAALAPGQRVCVNCRALLQSGDVEYSLISVLTGGLSGAVRCRDREACDRRRNEGRIVEVRNAD